MIYANFFRLSITLVSAFSFFELNAGDASKQPIKAAASLIIDDAEALRELTSINFFLHAPPSSRDAFKRMEHLVIEELKKNGNVLIEKMSVESLTDKLNVENGSLRNPSLTYSLKKIEDVEGKSLPIFEAALVLQAPATVEKNKTYCRPILWQRNVYVKSERDQSIEKVVSDTLDHFLTSFKKDYLEANQEAQIQPVFHFIE